MNLSWSFRWIAGLAFHWNFLCFFRWHLILFNVSYNQEMGLLPYSYCSSGVLVSFFMFTMSYRYKFPSAACRINISILNILNRSRSPVSLLYTGSANLVVNLYQPNFASTLCFPLKFSCHRLFVAHWRSIGIHSNLLCILLNTAQLLPNWYSSFL